jgi:hypothetical protein
MNVTERASRYVANMPPAISGSGGHAATFAVAVALRWGFDLTEDEAWRILLEYNERGEPPWSERELRHKLDSAATLSRHPQPRGYLRGSSNLPRTPSAKPAEPLRLRVVNWQQNAAEVRARMATQQTGATSAPPEAPAPSETCDAMPDLVAIALRIFPGSRILPDDGLDADMHNRLAAIERVLAQRDWKNRVAYTRTEVESCAIGLRRHRGTHPAVDAILERLDAAKKNALTWQVLAAR